MIAASEGTSVIEDFLINAAMCAETFPAMDAPDRAEREFKADVADIVLILVRVDNIFAWLHLGQWLLIVYLVHAIIILGRVKTMILLLELIRGKYQRIYIGKLIMITLNQDNSYFNFWNEDNTQMEEEFIEMRTGDFKKIFEIKRKLGGGSFADVFKAIRLSDGSAVALKFLKRNKRGKLSISKELKREVNILKESVKLEDERLLRFHDAYKLMSING